jgi:hypothetical protein
MTTPTRLSNRARTVSSAGSVAIFLLVAILGNEAFTEWVHRHHSAPSAGNYLLTVLTFPNWEFFPNSEANEAWQAWFARDLRAVLVIVFVAVLLSVGSRSLLSRGTGGLGGFVFGWGATMLGAAAAGLVSHLFRIGLDDGRWLLTAFQAAAAGATYGLFTGALVGAASSGARRG